MRLLRDDTANPLHERPKSTQAKALGAVTPCLIWGAVDLDKKPMGAGCD